MKFSVIIPVYQKANTVAVAVESVLLQTFRDFELIVVDDGSGDGLMEVLLPYLHRLRLLRQDNAGVSAARNAGIDAAAGEYVCFLDADDYWQEDHLAVLWDAICRFPQECFFSTLALTRSTDGTLHSKAGVLSGVPALLVVEDYFAFVLQKSTLINTDTVCIRRELAAAERFAEGERIGEDTDLWYRIAAYHALVLIRAETAVYCRDHSTATASGTGNLSWRFADRETELLSDVNISETKRESIARLLDRWRCACARECLLQGNDSAAAAYLSQYHRKDLRYWASILLCTVPKRLRPAVFEMVKKSLGMNKNE